MKVSISFQRLVDICRRAEPNSFTQIATGQEGILQEETEATERWKDGVERNQKVGSRNQKPEEHGLFFQAKELGGGGHGVGDEESLVNKIPLKSAHPQGIVFT